MKEIQLTQGQVALVDEGDFERLCQFKWYAYKSGKTFYARRNSPWINGNRSAVHMHHVIMGKPSKGFEIDHRSGVGTDNQRHNLRLVIHRQNCQNLKNRKKTSQHPGVSWNKQYQKWYAQIMINGEHNFLGSFVDELDAFEAYKQAVENLGETVIGNH